VPNHHPTGTGPTTEAHGPRNPDLARAEADVERARARVTDAVSALREEVVRRTDWREWFRARPLTYLAGALALGFLLGHRPRAGGSNPKNRRTWSWR
jgi:hypothetical protein